MDHGRTRDLYAPSSDHKVMTEQTTPRRMVKALLQGEPPPGPLLMPIIFSLGARLENLSKRDFQSNPTKIANALRQIRSALKIDGLTCYFDPFLEVEALGCQREWPADGSWTVTYPSFSSTDDLRGKLHSPEDMAARGHIPAACEVLRRLKVILKDEPALMVRVTGPFTIAAQLSRGNVEADRAAASPPRDLLEFAHEATATVAKSSVEAGADVVLLTEDFLPEMSPEACEWYGSLLSPIFNVIRFYEALPVLLLNIPTISERNLAAILAHAWDCVLCPAISNIGIAESLVSCTNYKEIAIALQPGIFCGDGADPAHLLSQLGCLISDSKLIFVTSAGDLPVSANMKSVGGLISTIRGRFRQQLSAQ